MSRRGGRALLAGLALLAPGGLVACGRVDEADKSRGERRPGVAVLSAVVEDHAVRVSPDRVGAGPLRVVVTNQGRRAVRVAMTRTGAGARAAAPELAPGGVTALRVDVTRGRWVLRAGDRTAGLVVARERRRADSELLQP